MLFCNNLSSKEIKVLDLMLLLCELDKTNKKKMKRYKGWEKNASKLIFKPEYNSNCMSKEYDVLYTTKIKKCTKCFFVIIYREIS